MTDPVEPPSPLEEVYAEVKRSLQGAALNVERLLIPLEGAVAAYRRALEAQVARDYAAAHSLRLPRPGVSSRLAAAQRLQELVLALPELGRAEPDVEAHPEAETTLAHEPSGAAARPLSTTGEKTLSDVLPRLAAGAGSRVLVILGALAGRKKTLPEPLASATEWVDTSQGGAHAALNLPTRIRQGRVLGVVICDQAVSHKHTEPVLAAARAAGVPVGFAGKGGSAGIARALRSIEQQLPV